MYLLQKNIIKKQKPLFFGGDVSLQEYLSFTPCLSAHT